jgi:hypothetical protein
MKILAAILVLLCVCGCTTYLPNGCLVEAASYRYSLQAKGALQHGWAKILIIGFNDQDVQHAALVFSTNGSDRHVYDAWAGSLPVRNCNTPLEVACRVYGNRRVAYAYYLN